MLLYGAKILRKNVTPLRRVHQRYRQTTDDIAMTVAERNVVTFCYRWETC